MDNLIKAVIPLSLGRNSFVINEIPCEAILEADEDLMALVLSKLIENTILSSRNSCIRISSVTGDDHIMICLKDNNSDYSKYISGKMNKVEPIIKKMGGRIEFEFNRRNSIAILISFVQGKKAA